MGSASGYLGQMGCREWQVQTTCCWSLGDVEAVFLESKHWPLIAGDFKMLNFQGSGSLPGNNGLRVIRWMNELYTILFFKT